MIHPTMARCSGGHKRADAVYLNDCKVSISQRVIKKAASDNGAPLISMYLTCVNR